MYFARNYRLLNFFLILPAMALLAVFPPAAQSKAPDTAASDANGAGRFRALAPGVEITIPADNDVQAATSRHDIVEVLASDPAFGERPYSEGRSPAKDTRFEHNIWALEFTFKPVRFVHVDVPTREGRMQRKQIWYFVYRVKNSGDQPVRFIPRFLLESWDTKKTYPSRVIPVATPAIQNREDAGLRLSNIDDLIPESPVRLLDTVQIMGEIPPSPAGQDNSVWGVATWEDIDPATDHFSVYVQGLSNAYRWTDAQDGDPPSYVYKAGDPLGTGRTIVQKTLRLNFWRPGDVFYEHEKEIRFGYHNHPGVERFGLTEAEKVDHLWTYR